MNTVKCPNCGNENKNTNIKCEFCGTEINHIEQNNNFYYKDYPQINLGSKKIKFIINAILIFLLIPWFLIGLIFIGVSTYSHISASNESKNYLETEGKLVSYDDCGSELCSAVYEYSVNGVIYKGSPNLLSNRSGFKNTVIVKYNPDKPNEYVINSGWNNLLITGVIMVTVVLLIFISGKKLLKKLFNKLNNTIEKDNQVTKRG